MYISFDLNRLQCLLPCISVRLDKSRPMMSTDSTRSAHEICLQDAAWWHPLPFSTSMSAHKKRNPFLGGTKPIGVMQASALCASRLNRDIYTRLQGRHSFGLGHPKCQRSDVIARCLRRTCSVPVHRFPAIVPGTWRRELHLGHEAELVAS